MLEECSGIATCSHVPYRLATTWTTTAMPSVGELCAMMSCMRCSMKVTSVRLFCRVVSRVRASCTVPLPRLQVGPLVPRTCNTHSLQLVPYIFGRGRDQHEWLSSVSVSVYRHQTFRLRQAGARLFSETFAVSVATLEREIVSD